MSTKELKELQVIDWPSDTESYELLDKECLKRETTVYVNWLDPFAEGQDKVQGIDRAGEAGGDVLRIQIGAVRGNCVKDKGECEQQRYLNYNNTTKWVRTNRWDRHEPRGLVPFGRPGADVRGEDGTSFLLEHRPAYT